MKGIFLSFQKWVVEKKGREWGIVGKKGREWGIVGKKGREWGVVGKKGREWGIVGILHLHTIQSVGEPALGIVLLRPSVQVHSNTGHGRVDLGIKVSVVLNNLSLLKPPLHVGRFLSQLTKC